MKISKMNKKKAERRIKKLRETINKHRYLYHVLDKQEISEEALDSLKKELFDLESQFPDLITPDSPTQRVAGEPLDQFEKYRHPEPMLSLQDAFSKEDMKEWKSRMRRHLKEEINPEYFCEYKMDGLAMELIYEDSILKTAATRGDGEVGENVTENVKTIEAIPLKIISPEKLPQQERNGNKKIDNVIVRGEILINKKEFKKINERREKEGESTYANPRNLAAGSIRQLNPKVVASRNLNFFAYDLIDPNSSEGSVIPFGAKTHSEKHQILRRLGFKTTKEKICQNLEEVFDFREKSKEERKDLDYEIDGIAVFVNDNNLFERLAVVGKGPRGAIAYKFPLKKATTEVEDIKVQIGRTGSATPVAVLNPVEVGGVSISRASLHNEDEMDRLGIKIGDTAVVGRAGDVIPYVIKILPEMRTGEEKEFHFPKKCPICKGELVKKEGEVARKCINKNCKAQKKEKLKHFASKSAFNIDGLGESIIDQLMNEGLVSDIPDFFRLKKGDLIPLERFGEKAAENLIKAIENSKKITLGRFIYSLGIEQVGEVTAYTLADNFGSLKNLSKASEEDLLKIEDIGPKGARKIKKWFDRKKNLEMIEELKELGVKIEFQEKKDDLKGKIFVFTGKLNSFTRREAKERVVSLGGKVSSSVSGRTDYLVAGENPGSKFEKAKKENVNILTEKEFKNL